MTQERAKRLRSRDSPEKRFYGRNYAPWRDDFPGAGELWYKAPYRLFLGGLARDMGGSEFKRYGTLSFIGSCWKTNVFQVDEEELKRLDGVSVRRARDIHVKLEERGLLELDRTVKPYLFRLLLPSSWKDGDGSALTLDKKGRRVTVCVSQNAANFAASWDGRAAKVAEPTGQNCRNLKAKPLPGYEIQTAFSFLL